MSDEKAVRMCARYNSAKTNYDEIAPLHQACMDYSMPRKSNVNVDKREGLAGDWGANLYDDEAINGVQVLASGQLDWLFSGRWVEAVSPFEGAPQAVEDYYSLTGEIALRHLNASNFPLEAHEFLLDRSSAGTSHLHCEETPLGDEIPFYFFNDDVGNYVIEEDPVGMVSKWWGIRKWTVEQAMTMWPNQNLGESVDTSIKKPNGTGLSDKYDFLYFIGPRESAERVHGSKAKIDKPWALEVYNLKDKVTIEEGGYDEKPMFVSRYLKWGSSPYGYSPCIQALPTIRGVNGAEKMREVLTELQAFPRILVPSDLDGFVEVGPSGITVFNESTDSKPEEWLTGGRGDILKDQAEGMRARIRRAFHVELFQMLTNMEEMRREKTATEVRAMLAEKISHFSPTFQRLRVEILKPLLDRVFLILKRKGYFPPAPPEVAELEAIEGPVLPEFQYTSKLGLAIRANENLAYNDFQAVVGGIFELFPEKVDQILNVDRTVRRVGDNFGLPVEMWNTQDEREAKEEEAAARQKAAEEMALAEAGSNVVKNLNGAPQMPTLN